MLLTLSSPLLVDRDIQNGTTRTTALLDAPHEQDVFAKPLQNNQLGPWPDFNKLFNCPHSLTTKDFVFSEMLDRSISLQPRKDPSAAA